MGPDPWAKDLTHMKGLGGGETTTLHRKCWDQMYTMFSDGNKKTEKSCLKIGRKVQKGCLENISFSVVVTIRTLVQQSLHIARFIALKIVLGLTKLPSLHLCKVGPSGQ